MDKNFLSEIIDKSEIILGQYGNRKHYKNQIVTILVTSYDIFNVISGSYTLLINGKKYNARTRDSFLLTPNCKFTIIANEKSMQLFYHFSIIFAGRNFAGDLDEYRLPADYMFLIKLFNKYTNDCVNNDIFTRTAIKPIIKLIFNRMIFLNEKNYNSFISNINKIYTNQLLNVIRYIHFHPWIPIKISYLAKMAGYNESYFSTYFKKNVGISISNYIDNVKMNAAKDLLIEKDLSIKEAARELGFSDQYIFSKKFKKHFGISPNEFKKLDI